MKSYCYHDTPIGRLLLVGTSTALEELHFPNSKKPRQPSPDWQEEKEPFSKVIEQLDQFFAGKRKSFDIPLHPEGTVFQKKVWQALRGIPFGKTASYSEIAATIGNPKGCRAVGLANARNPIPIIIPCHRVIAKSGSLSGFGGGVETKRYLLDLENEVR